MRSRSVQFPPPAPTCGPPRIGPTALAEIGQADPQETENIMFRSVLREARTWSGYWRRRVALSWALRDKSDLGFPAMVAVPILVLGSIIYFAYTTRDNFDGTKLEAALKR